MPAKRTRAHRDGEGVRILKQATKLAKRDARRAMRSAGVLDVEPEAVDDWPYSDDRPPVPNPRRSLEEIFDQFPGRRP